MQLQSPQYGAHDCCGPSPLDPHPGVAALRSLLGVGGAQTCNNISIMWLDEPLGLIYVLISTGPSFVYLKSYTCRLVSESGICQLLVTDGISQLFAPPQVERYPSRSQKIANRVDIA